MVSFTKLIPPNKGDEPATAYHLNARLPLIAKLTDAELENPIVKAVRSALSFEEQRTFSRENLHEFKRTEGLERARSLLIFARPERRPELEALLAKEVD